MKHSQEICMKTLREALTSASGFVSYKNIHAMCRRVGQPLNTGHSNLSRFGDGRVKCINLTDAAKLSFFLFQTDMGRIIRGAPVPASMADDRLNAYLRTPSHNSDSRDVAGSYFAIHGSYNKPSHFVVRAIIVERQANGVLSVRDYLRDEAGLEPDSVLEASGTLLFEKGRPTLLLRRMLGVSVLFADQLMPAAGAIKTMSGQMFGVSRTHLPFSRSFIMQRTPVPYEVDDMLPQTGIYRVDQLAPSMRELLLRLVRNLPPLCFADPVLVLTS